MKFANRQRGMSSAGWMMTLATVGMSLLIAFKMIPYYIDDSAIGRTLDSLTEKPGIDAASVRDIRNYINKGFQTNSIRDFDKDDVEIYEEDGFMKVDINYEKRVHLVSNVDVVMTFNHNWQIKNQ